MKYQYDVIRSARKSISISITDDNYITVRCPWGMSIAKVNEFIESKEAWIERVAMRNATRLAANDDVIEYRAIYVKGRKLPLVFSDCNKITEDTVYVIDRDNIQKLYMDEYADKFIREVNELAKEIIVKPTSVGIKAFTSRWGCCDAANNLVFNFILFMLPDEIQRYVIIHELCHIICHNHSKAFWKLVSDYQPDYKVLKKRLEAYSILTQLY